MTITAPVDGDPIDPAWAQLITDAVNTLNADARYRAAYTTAGVEGSVVFTGIPTTLKTIRVSATCRGDFAGAATELMIRINGSSSGVYRHNSMFSQNGGAVNQGSAFAQTSARVCVIPGATATAGVFAGAHLVINGWDSPHATHLTMESHGGYLDAAGNQIVYTGSQAALITGPYSSITFLPVANSFIAGCEFLLEGLP
jgi:hypothetical protein